jgi:hypothetical protein
MLKVISFLFVCFIGTNLLAQHHPYTFITKEEGLLISTSISKYPLLKSSFLEVKKEVESYLNSDADAPIPKDPDMHIFQHWESVLKIAINTCLQQTNLDGSFFSINDALKEKDFISNELVTSIDIARNRYGLDVGLLSVAKKQNRISLDKGGVLVAAGIKNNKQY